MKKLFPVVLVAFSLACGGTASPTAPERSAPISISAGPITIDTGILTSSACPTRFGFGLNLTIIVRGGSGGRLRVITFEFVDRFGRHARPDVIDTLPQPGASTSMPTASPIPFPTPASLPSTGPLPLPGSMPLQSLIVAGDAPRPLPFFLRFGCGVMSEGTLVIIVEGTDTTGAPFKSELQLQVGG